MAASGRSIRCYSPLMASLAVLMLLSACGGSGGSGAAAAVSGGGTTTITGSAGDGPITGGTLSVTDGNGKAVTTTPASPVTDATAHYSFTILSTTPLPLTVTLTNGKDTVTGVTQDFDLTAVETSALTAGGTLILNSNPISTLVVASAKAKGALTAASLAAATINVLNTVGFGLPAGFDPETTRVDATNVAAVIKANEAVAELIRRTRVSTGKTMANTITAIAEDTTDGVLDGKAAAGITATQATPGTAGVILTRQAEISAALLAGQLKITDKTGATRVTAANMRKTLNAAILVTQPAAKGAEADVSQVKVTQKFKDETLNAISLANLLTGSGNATLNNLKAVVYALIVKAVPGTAEASSIETALTNANTAITTADDNAKKGTNTAIIGTAARKANKAPVFTGTPAISGTVAVGSTLSLTGTAAKDADSNTLALSYQWYANGAVIAGAIGTSYVVKAADAGKRITAVITANDGQNAANSATSVVTAGIMDTTAPTITSKTPGAGVTGVATNASVNITFSEPMDPATITTANFTVKAGPTTVSGTITHNSGNIETFIPSASMAFNTLYTVAVTSTITDVAGNALTATGGQPLSWSFTTASPPPPQKVGGTVSGLATGESVVLQNNGVDNLSVAANGTFTFATAIANGSTYAVTVSTQPAGRFCTVGRGSGTISSAAVSNVSVLCFHPLNDTGITTWGNASSNSLAVTQTSNPVVSTDFPGQDADKGRDALARSGTLTKVGASTNNTTQGFDFTKLDSTGTPLTTQTASYATTPWDCVKDNNTGLMWEVKTTTVGLRNSTNSYSWYNSNTTTNGGNAGTVGGGICTGGTGCDTEKYVADVNALTGTSRICGFTDWRLPTREELFSIVDYSLASFNKTIDTGYFPNIIASFYWSASPSAGVAALAWVVNFNGGNDDIDFKSFAHFVRLVRAGQ